MSTTLKKRFTFNYQEECLVSMQFVCFVFKTLFGFCMPILTHFLSNCHLLKGWNDCFTRSNQSLQWQYYILSPNKSRGCNMLKASLVHSTKQWCRKVHWKPSVNLHLWRKPPLSSFYISCNWNPAKV